MIEIFTFSSSVMDTYTITAVVLYGLKVKLIKFSMLEKFPNNIQNVVEEHPYSILKKRHYKEVVLYFLQS